MIRGSFNSSIEYFVCPDAAVFLVYEKYFLDFNNPEYQEIEFYVKIKDEYKEKEPDFASQTFIMSVFNFPYYDAEAYREYGHLLWSKNYFTYSYHDATG